MTKRRYRSVHLIARWYRDTLHLTIRGSIRAALAERYSVPGTI